MKGLYFCHEKKKEIPEKAPRQKNKIQKLEEREEKMCDIKKKLSSNTALSKKKNITLPKETHDNRAPNPPLFICKKNRQSGLNSQLSVQRRRVESTKT
jgi:hypothetical protein